MWSEIIHHIPLHPRTRTQGSRETMDAILHLSTSPLQELHKIQHIADMESGEAQAKQLAQVILAQEGRADYRTNLVLKSVAASSSRLSVNTVIENNVFPTNAQCLFFNTPVPSLVPPGKGSSPGLE